MKEVITTYVFYIVESKDDYQELMEYMKTNNLSADEVLKKIKK